ncbi:MAG: DUF1236 domain-containing protein [Xanthobacteraceae bacterium]
MRNTFLITVATAALVAGAGLASAQGVNERSDPHAAAAPEQKAPTGKADQKLNAPKTSQSVAPAPIAHTLEKAKPAPVAEAPEKGKQAPLAQAPEKAPGSKRDTSGQGSGSQSQQPSPPHDAQSPSKEGGPHAAVPGEPKSGASVIPLSTEQHARIRDTIRGEKVEHLSNVQFSISVGEAVPQTVHLFRLPAQIVDYAPQYQDYEYILVGDDILIVDPRTLRIVAVIAS